jgi:DNA-binding MarR family transcriptional regulator
VDNNPQMMELPVLFKHLVKTMTHAWRSKMGDLSLTQFRVLFHLNADGPYKATELADKVQVTSGAVTGIADRMIERGWIERERDGIDRRVVLLRITPAGRQLLESLLESQQETIAAFFKGLPHEDIEHLKRIFTKLLDQINEMNRG